MPVGARYTCYSVDQLELRLQSNAKKNARKANSIPGKWRADGLSSRNFTPTSLTCSLVMFGPTFEQEYRGEKASKYAVITPRHTP